MIFHCMAVFTHPSVIGLSRCFHLPAAVSKAAVIIPVQVSVGTCDFMALEYILKWSGIAGSRGSSMFNL